MRKYLFSCVYVGLQVTDVELDERVTALEENGGSSPQNGKQYTNIYVISHQSLFS